MRRPNQEGDIQSIHRFLQQSTEILITPTVRLQNTFTQRLFARARAITCIAKRLEIDKCATVLITNFRTPPKMAASTDEINDILTNLPHLRRGTGGVAAVVKDGKVLGKKAWGYADLDQRVPMTTKTVFPICSISKQMVCLAMQSLLQKPTASMAERKESPEEQMQAELHKLLPHLKDAEGGADLKVADLYNMQSGIRDYWAM